MNLFKGALALSALVLLATCEKDPAQAGRRAGPGARLMTVNPSTLVAGQGGGMVTVSATGFPAHRPIQVWLDANRNGLFEASEGLTLSPVGGPPDVTTVTSDAAGAFTRDFKFAADVAAGSYSILAGVCSPTLPADACFGISGAAAAPVLIALGVSHSKFGSGSIVTVTGVGFPASTSISVWYDTNPNGTLTAGTSSVSVATDASGAFSTPLTVDAAPAIESLFALLSGHAGVATLGAFFIHAGPSTTAQQTLQVEIGSCWFNECLIYDSAGNAADTLCLFGNSPKDSFTYFADCKTLDANYTNPTGYDFSNQGPTFAGAGVLAAMLNDIGGVPGSGCPAMTAAIIAAETVYGNSVPDKVSLLAIACPPFPVPLGLYVLGVEVSGHSVPDKGVMFAAVAAINAAAVAAGVAVAAVSGTALTVGPLLGPIVGAAVSAASSAGVDPATASALGASVGASAVGAIATLGVAGGALAPVVTLAIIGAAQFVLAEAAVAGAIACGFVNYYCDGSDLTANILAHPLLQKKPVPIPFLQPPFKPPPSPNPCVGLTGTCWGSIIGWAQAVCTSPVSGTCNAAPLLAVPGSAGVNNGDPTNLQCVNGKVVGLSIGYDGDIAFSLNGDPSILPLTNYHNYLPGPGGTEPPNGLDIEIPLKNPLGDPSLILSPALRPILAQLRAGTFVHVCGHWVADMHMFWNELHPITLLSLATDFTLVASPSDLTLQSGETGSLTITATWLSGPSSPVTLSVVSGLPAGVTPSPSSVTVASGAPATSALTISNLPLGDHEIVIQGKSPEEVIRTATVRVHVYDYGLAVSPADQTVLRGGHTSYAVTATLVPGSSTTALPSIALSPQGLPVDASASLASPSVVPALSPGLSTTVSVSTATAGSLGDFGFTVSGTNPSGITRTSDPANLHLYDFSLAATPPSLQVLTTGSNGYLVTVALAPGSSLLGLPSIGLSDAGLPPNTVGIFNPISASAAGFSSMFAITTSNASSSPGLPLIIAGTDARTPEGGSRTTTATLVILTPAQALGLLIDRIGSFNLNRGQTNSLITKLEHAIASLTLRPPPQPTACNQIHALVNEVNAYLHAGLLTQAQADLLLGGPLGIDAIRAAIPCR